jgi:hypothetical protein
MIDPGVAYLLILSRSPFHARHPMFPTLPVSDRASGQNATNPFSFFCSLSIKYGIEADEQKGLLRLVQAVHNAIQ